MNRLPPFPLWPHAVSRVCHETEFRKEITLIYTVKSRVGENPIKFALVFRNIMGTIFREKKSITPVSLVTNALFLACALCVKPAAFYVNINFINIMVWNVIIISKGVYLLKCNIHEQRFYANTDLSYRSLILWANIFAESDVLSDSLLHSFSMEGLILASKTLPDCNRKFLFRNSFPFINKYLILIYVHTHAPT